MYESELALRLTPYVAGEQPKNRKFIKLNTNENPYPPSPRVAEVLRSFDAASLRLYPDMDATALREAISAVEGVPADWVFCGNGSDEVLAFAFAAFFAGKTVAIPAVTYSFYPVYANLYGAKVASVPMKPDFRWMWMVCALPAPLPWRTRTPRPAWHSRWMYCGIWRRTRATAAKCC